MTLKDSRADYAGRMSGILTRARASHGSKFHASLCLGMIDGAAASLKDAAGPEQAAMALYSAADEMILRNIPAPELRPRRKRPMRRVRSALAQVAVTDWCFVAMLVMGLYGVWRWM